MSDEFSKLMRLVRVTANATVDLARHDGRDRVGGSYRHKRCSKCPLNEADALCDALDVAKQEGEVEACAEAAEHMAVFIGHDGGDRG